MPSTMRTRATPIVKLPTSEALSHMQTVAGKLSPISPDIEEFRGIPYGMVSVRWGPSQLRTRLPQDDFDATKDGPRCVQPSGPYTSDIFQSYIPFPEDEESEFDCLNLLIVRPSAVALKQHGIDSTTTGLPVFVWIHGGSFAFGAANTPIWDPSRLVLRSITKKSPIIVVCINYRLNIFGFAASTDILKSQDVTGVRGLNFGIRDQKVALEWISRNIGAFGGDPEKVTIGGQSSGSVAVHHHIAEANACSGKPLFKRAIMESGVMGTLGPNPIKEADESWEALCRELGVEGRTNECDRVDQLRQIPAASLLDAAGKIGLEAYPTFFDNITIKPGTLTKGDITVDLGPVEPLTSSTNSAPTGIDVLIGVTDKEFDDSIIPRPVSWDQIQSVFEKEYTETTLRSKVMEAYNLSNTASSPELKDGLVSFVNDRVFEVPAHLARRTLGSHRHLASEPEANRVHSFHVAFGNPFPGPRQGVAHHCVELIYLFDAFHDALVQADREIQQHLPPPKGAEEPRYERTNIELCKAVQDHWLHYIASDGSEDKNTSNEITVFGKDRKTRVESLTDTPFWKKRVERWCVASEDFDAMTRVRRCLRDLK